MPTRWALFTCAHGARWAETVPAETKDGGRCYFSGCTDDHCVELVRITTSREEAHDWFRRPEPTK